MQDAPFLAISGQTTNPGGVGTDAFPMTAEKFCVSYTNAEMPDIIAGKPCFGDKSFQRRENERQGSPPGKPDVP